MFVFAIIDVTDENRVENLDYVDIVSIEMFDNYSDACIKCDATIEQYLKDYVECDDEEDNEEEYYHSLYVDNKKYFRNVLLTFEDSRQFIVMKVGE